MPLNSAGRVPEPDRADHSYRAGGMREVCRLPFNHCESPSLKVGVILIQMKNNVTMS